MKIISPDMHGFSDYIVALVLIVAPFVLFSAQTDPLVFYIPVVAGVGLISYSIITDNAAGLKRIIPFKMHLAIDFVATAGFVVLAFILDLQGIEKLFYLGMGLGGMIFVLTTKTE